MSTVEEKLMNFPRNHATNVILLNLKYNQYCMEFLSFVSKIDPRMDIMQMPNSIIDKAAKKSFVQEIQLKMIPFVSSVHRTHRTAGKCIQLLYTIQALCILSICRIRKVEG